MNFNDNSLISNMDKKLAEMDTDELMMFLEEAEKKASELEVTVDYYIAEFC